LWSALAWPRWDIEDAAHYDTRPGGSNPALQSGFIGLMGVFFARLDALWHHAGSDPDWASARKPPGKPCCFQWLCLAGAILAIGFGMDWALT
jgi:hypothetical protein